MDIKIRLATPDDAEALLGIYSYYVENTPITYELVPPTVEDFRNRITKVLKAYPYLVADLNSPQSNGDINSSPNWGRPGGGLNIRYRQHIGKHTCRCNTGTGTKALYQHRELLIA